MTTSSTNANKKPSALQSFLGGGVAGVVSRTMVSPLERLKILYQVQFVTGFEVKAKYTSQWDSLKLMYREEGWRSFFKGNGANCIRVFPYTGIQFLSLAQFSEFLKRRGNKETLSPFEKQFVGGMAGVTSVLFTYPMDMVRGRLTASGGVKIKNGEYKGMFDGIVKIARNEGVRSLFSGLSATLVGIYPYVALNYLTYETIKEKKPAMLGGTNDAIWRLLAGGVAGMVGQTVAYPLDLLRRRFQLQNAPGNEYPLEKRYKSLPHAFRMIYAAEGFPGFFKGFNVNFIKTWLTIGIAFNINDACIDLFRMFS